MMTQTIPQELAAIRAASGKAQTTGLDDETLARFYEQDEVLRDAVALASRRLQALLPEERELIKGDEVAVCAKLQEHILSFYGDEARSPYVPLAARGPWVVTAYGAVVYDCGGYGMLGLGHAPQDVIDSLDEPWVMANVMTPNLSHHRFTELLRKEIGQQRGSCPFGRFLFLNSGSEAVTMAGRMMDIKSKLVTDPGAKFERKTLKYLSLEGSFHGRTYPAALVSDSTMKAYRQHMVTLRDYNGLDLVKVNDLESLQAAFDRAKRENIYYMGLFLEPVMGEGRPGQAISREFYDLARKLTKEHDTLLLVDSIQAGLRATGYLSIIDYPGFEDCEAPDMETYSKAINAGQYPLSVLALRQETAGLYKTGVYGNTMTSAPRALQAGVIVLSSLTPELRANIRERGVEFVEKLHGLAQEFSDIVVSVMGTGLLMAMELIPEMPVTGLGGIEQSLRKQGVNIIHGGKNALRLTPVFGIKSSEIDLIIDLLRKELAARSS